uniref:Uncharacterized protein n=1 Tax=Oncorhynchus kisutch TaxID=8019 RepID=A0A8C7I7V3_ONCKI
METRGRYWSLKDWPLSRRFSISTRVLTPSTTICTSSTSEKPRRSALEMSKTPPTAAVSTPPGGGRYQRKAEPNGADTVGFSATRGDRLKTRKSAPIDLDL